MTQETKLSMNEIILRLAKLQSDLDYIKEKIKSEEEKELENEIKIWEKASEEDILNWEKENLNDG